MPESREEGEDGDQGVNEAAQPTRGRLSPANIPKIWKEWDLRLFVWVLLSPPTASFTPLSHSRRS